MVPTAFLSDARHAYCLFVWCSLWEWSEEVEHAELPVDKPLLWSLGYDVMKSLLIEQKMLP